MKELWTIRSSIYSGVSDIYLVQFKIYFLRRKSNSIFLSCFRAEWAICLQIYIKIHADNLVYPYITNKCISILSRFLLYICFIEFISVWKKVLKKVLLLKSFSFVFEIHFEDVSAMRSGLLRALVNMHPHLTCFYGNAQFFLQLKLLWFMTWNTKTQ